MRGEGEKKRGKWGRGLMSERVDKGEEGEEGI